MSRLRVIQSMVLYYIVLLRIVCIGAKLEGRSSICVRDISQGDVIMLYQFASLIPCVCLFGVVCHSKLERMRPNGG